MVKQGVITFSFNGGSFLFESEFKLWLFSSKFLKLSLVSKYHLENVSISANNP